MKKLLLSLSMLFSIPVIAGLQNPTLLISLMNKDGSINHAVDFAKSTFSDRDNKATHYAFTAGGANVSASIAGMLPVAHKVLKCVYASKCQGKAVSKKECEELKRMIRRMELQLEVVPLNSKMNQEIMQDLKADVDIEEMAKLRNEFSEVTRVKIEFSYDNPEVTIVPIPEGATADASSAAPTESAPVESSN